MSSYVHHVPGRMRVKCASLKRNEAKAGSLREGLLNLEGVTRVEANTITGSLVIHYHRDITDTKQLTSFLDCKGGIHTQSIEGVPAHHNPVAGMTQVGGWLGKAVFGAVLEKVIERSALALVAAII